MWHILSLLGGVEILLLFVTLRKMERLQEIEAEIHACAVDLAHALEFRQAGTTRRKPLPSVGATAAGRFGRASATSGSRRLLHRRAVGNEQHLCPETP
jgi:hypothetical protein